MNCNRASTHHTIIDDINIPIDAKIMFSVNFSVYTTQLLSYKMLKKFEHKVYTVIKSPVDMIIVPF
ncbi:Uncharacterised protein [Vibrio cholerae]|nr:Uncharacterised protein [Vibrio cholerae]